MLNNFRGSGGGSDEQPQKAKEAPDTLVSKQYLRIVDLISNGPVEGLANGLSSIYIAGTPIINPDGTKNIDGFSVWGRPGTSDQEIIPGFELQESEQSVSVKVVQNTPIIRTLRSTELDSVRVSVGIPTLQSINDNGDINPTSVELEISIQSNGGGFVPQTIGEKKETTASTYIVKSSDTLCTMLLPCKKVGLSVSWTGTNSLSRQYVAFNLQRAPTGTSNWVTIASQQFEGKATNPSPYAYALDYITHPSQTFFWYDEAEETRYDYRIVTTEIENTNPVSFNASQLEAWTKNTTDVITGKCSSKYIKAYRLSLPGTGPWDVRVRRITQDSTSSYLSNDLYWETYTEIIDAKFTYPYSAYVAMSVDASLYNNIPDRAYHVKGMLVKVPVNYNPVSRTYNGVWNGITWKSVYTDNPVWCLRDLLTNSMYGAGQFISEDHLNDSSFYEIAQYCDEFVPDGYGGTEPRYTCSLYIQSRESLYKVLNDMASIFCGMLYWSSGSICLVADKKEDPLWLFTNANVINGEFTYQGSSKNTRHTVALVTYRDKTDRFQEKVEYVEDTDSIPKFGIKSTSVVAVGATTRGQAHRFGKNILLSERYLTETVSFKTGIEGLGSGLYPGAVIQIMDANRAGSRLGGRIEFADTTKVVLDASVQVQAGAAYTLSYITPTGLVEEHAVTFSTSSAALTALGDGDTYIGIPVPIVDSEGKAIGVLIQEEASTTLLFNSPITNVPQRMAVWILQTNNLQAQTFRVVGIKEDGKCEYIITGLAYNASKYDAVDFNTKFIPTPTSVPQRWYAPSPENVEIEEELYIDLSGAVSSRINVSMDKPEYPLFDYFKLYWRYTDGEWTEEPIFRTNFTSISPVKQKEIEISVESVNQYGIHSFKVFKTYIVTGDTFGAPVPQNPLLFATPDQYGNITKARLRVSFTKNQAEVDFGGKISGLMVFVSNFAYENWARVSEGGTGTTLTIDGTAFLQHDYTPILAGSTRNRVVLRTPDNPFDPNANHGGRFWGKLPTSLWRKIVQVDNVALYFDDPLDVDPVPGDLLEWLEMSWADNRLDQAKTAILSDGTNYEIIKWADMEQNPSTGKIELTNCIRGAEGTSVIEADGKKLHYYPAPGAGTKIIRFPVECFNLTGELTFTGETDTDLSIPAGSFSSVSAAVYLTKYDGTVTRSYIVPVSYGGPM